LDVLGFFVLVDSNWLHHRWFNYRTLRLFLLLANFLFFFFLWLFLWLLLRRVNDSLL
jgi:hypothetical protein